MRMKSLRDIYGYRSVDSGYFSDEYRQGSIDLTGAGVWIGSGNTKRKSTSILLTT